MSITNFPKIGYEYKFIDVKVPVYIDCSSSTTILDNEISIVKDLNHHKIYFNNNVPNEFKPTRSPIVMLIINSGISQVGIIKFMNEMNKYSMKSLYIYVIVGNEKKDLNNYNNPSIVLMMKMINFLYLYYDVDNNKTYVLASNGSISNIYKNEFHEIDINDLNNIRYKMIDIPDEYIILSEDERYYKAIKIDDIYNSENLLQLNNDEINEIIKYSVIKDNLHKLEDLIPKLHDKDIQNISSKIDGEYKFIYRKERDNIFDEIMKVNNDNLQNEYLLRDKLDEIKEKVQDEGIEFILYKISNLVQIRKKWNSIKMRTNIYNNTMVNIMKYN